VNLVNVTFVETMPVRRHRILPGSATYSANHAFDALTTQIEVISPPDVAIDTILALQPTKRTGRCISAFEYWSEHGLGTFEIGGRCYNSGYGAV